MQSEAPEPVADAADATQPDQVTFADLGLDDAVLKALRDVGYETPSPIQAATIPPLLEGRDVVGLAQTGTGKTAAFALPILVPARPRRRRRRRRSCSPRPASSRSRSARRSRSTPPTCKGVHVLPVYGGQGYGVQLSRAAPRRARRRRHARAASWTTSRRAPSTSRELRFLVLDEADEMLNMGFAEDVETILADTPDDKHVALFSATMPAQIRRISKKYLHDPVEITVKNKTTTVGRTSPSAT